VSDPKKLSHEALLEWIDRLAVSWLRSRKPEFLVAWKQFDDERKTRKKSIWNWFRK
jgi:hypothetical protein